MITTQSKIISFNNKDYTLSYLEKKGTDEIIVYLHGLGANNSYFAPVMELDGLRSYQQIAIDMLGYGESSKPQDFSYTMEDQAKVLYLFLDSYGFNKIHLVLHSMAGAVGLYLAQMLKDRVKSIVNMEGNLIGSDCGIGSRGVSKMEYEDYTALYAQMIQNVDDPFSAFLVTADIKGFYESAIDLVKVSDSGELLELFNDIDIPKMYIHGIRDRNDELLSLLADSESIKIVEVPDAGHSMHMDNLDVFYKELDNFLSVKEEPA